MKFNIFKSFTLTWWQGGMYKWGMLALGIAVGANWPGIFVSYLAALLVFAAITLGYIGYVWAKQ
jgi:hypothetical protein